MSDLDHEIRRGLERLGDPTGRTEPLTLDRVAGRRRRRRIRNAVVTVVPVAALLVVIGLLVPFGADDRDAVIADGVADGSSRPAAGPTLSVERTEVVGDDGGTAQVVMEFDGSLPARSVRHVDDITTVDAPDEIIYAIQDSAESVHVCGDVHWFPPPAEGTVDVLIPEDWFADGDDAHTSPLDLIDDPAKFVVCGPHDGYYQYAIWGPASADAADVSVTVDPDGRRLTVQIGPAPDPATDPASISQGDADAA